MAYTNPSAAPWANGYLVNATDFNTYIRDNLLHIAGTGGVLAATTGLNAVTDQTLQVNSSATGSPFFRINPTVSGEHALFADAGSSGNGLAIGVYTNGVKRLTIGSSSSGGGGVSVTGALTVGSTLSVGSTSTLTQVVVTGSQTVAGQFSVAGATTLATTSVGGGTVATGGVLNMQNGAQIQWRNAANSANIGLTMDGNDHLYINGVQGTTTSGPSVSGAGGSIGSNNPEYWWIVTINGADRKIPVFRN